MRSLKIIMLFSVLYVNSAMEIKRGNQVKTMVKLSAPSMTTELNIDLENAVKCSDGKHYCEDGYTCCDYASSDSMCCYGVHAVCCSGLLRNYCCPEGYSCSSGGLCS